MLRRKLLLELYIICGKFETRGDYLDSSWDFFQENIHSNSVYHSHQKTFISDQQKLETIQIDYYHWLKVFCQKASRMEAIMPHCPDKKLEPFSIVLFG